MTTLNGRLERLERELVTIVAASAPPAARPLNGPVPSDEEAEAAWARVVARIYREIAERDRSGRPEWVVELLGDELLPGHEDVARQHAEADDALVARWLAARSEGGWRGLEERKHQVVQERTDLFLEILNEIAATLVEPYLGQVLADHERKALTSPISIHMNALAWRALWTRTGEAHPSMGYHGPLAMPEAICRVLTEHPEGAGDLWRECAQCGLVIPSKRLDPPIQSVTCTTTLHTCPHCGGTDIGPHRYYDRHREELVPSGG